MGRVEVGEAVQREYVVRRTLVGELASCES
jgi:hypothetical protein